MNSGQQSPGADKVDFVDEVGPVNPPSSINAESEQALVRKLDFTVLPIGKGASDIEAY